jgi:hypothetical protein
MVSDDHKWSRCYQCFISPSLNHSLCHQLQSYVMLQIVVSLTIVNYDPNSVIIQATEFINFLSLSSFKIMYIGGHLPPSSHCSREIFVGPVASIIQIFWLWLVTIISEACTANVLLALTLNLASVISYNHMWCSKMCCHLWSSFMFVIVL